MSDDESFVILTSSRCPSMEEHKEQNTSMITKKDLQNGSIIFNFKDSMELYEQSSKSFSLLNPTSLTLSESGLSENVNLKSVSLAKSSENNDDTQLTNDVVSSASGLHFTEKFAMGEIPVKHSISKNDPSLCTSQWKNEGISELESLCNESNQASKIAQCNEIIAQLKEELRLKIDENQKLDIELTERDGLIQILKSEITSCINILKSNGNSGMNFGSSMPNWTVHSGNIQSFVNNESTYSARAQQEKNQTQPHTKPTMNTKPGNQERRFSNANQYPDNHQIFVGNVPPYATENELTQLFSKFGKVVDVRICSKSVVRLPGRSPPNYGYITYDDPDSVQLCLDDQPLYFSDGQKLNIEKKKTRNTKGRSSSAGSGGMNRNMANVGNGPRMHRGNNDWGNDRNSVGDRGADRGQMNQDTLSEANTNVANGRMDHGNDCILAKHARYGSWNRRPNKQH